MRHFINSLLIMVGIIGLVAVAIPATPAYAAPCKGGAFLTFPAWYKRLNCEGGGVTLGNTQKTIQKSITQIVLNIIDILSQLAGYACIVFIIIGGFRYMTSAGTPNGMTAARKTIMNAIIGLVIAILAVVIVNLVGAAL